MAGEVSKNSVYGSLTPTEQAGCDAVEELNAEQSVTDFLGCAPVRRGPKATGKDGTLARVNSDAFTLAARDPAEMTAAERLILTRRIS